jgi:hypothetical protein
MPKNDEEKTVEKDAAVAEVKAETVKFTYDGVEYEVSATADVYDSLDFREAMEDSDHTLMARALLGPRQWAQFKLTHKKYTQAIEMINAWGDAVGLGK